MLLLSITPTCPSSTIIIKNIFLYFLFILTLSFYCNQSYGQGKTLIYKYKSAKGVLSFSDTQPLNTSYEQVRVNCYACQLNSPISWHKTTLYLTQYSNDINRAAALYKVEPAFIRAIIHAESHFDVKAISKQGAQGLMQLMPKTAQMLGVKNPFIAKQNINGGVKHLAYLLNTYQGNNSLVAAAYNAGEGAVKKYSGIPPFKETKVYVERVGILYQRYLKTL